MNFIKCMLIRTYLWLAQSKDLFVCRYFGCKFCYVSEYTERFGYVDYRVCTRCVEIESPYE